MECWSRAIAETERLFRFNQLRFSLLSHSAERLSESKQHIIFEKASVLVDGYFNSFGDKVNL